jgi:hypothetical protein
MVFVIKTQFIFYEVSYLDEVFRTPRDPLWYLRWRNSHVPEFYPSASFFRLSASFHRSSTLSFTCPLVLSAKQPKPKSLRKAVVFPKSQSAERPRVSAVFSPPCSLSKDLRYLLSNLDVPGGRAAQPDYCQCPQSASVPVSWTSPTRSVLSLCYFAGILHSGR